MRPINILSVCGSGTVSSAMLTSKLTDILEENGYEVEATEVAPGGVELAVQTGSCISCLFYRYRYDVYRSWTFVPDYFVAGKVDRHFHAVRSVE